MKEYYVLLLVWLSCFDMLHCKWGAIVHPQLAFNLNPEKKAVVMRTPYQNH